MHPIVLTADELYTNADDVIASTNERQTIRGQTDGQTDGETELLYQYRASVC